MTPSPAQPISIVVVTCMFNRPRVSELFATRYHILKSYKPDMYRIECVAAVSDDESAAVCQAYGIHTSHIENTPLGRKWNLAMETALILGFDYALILGDDDIMACELLDEYLEYLRASVPFFGVRELYVYSPRHNAAVRFSYPESVAKLVGCGRMIHRSAIEKAGWHTRIVARRNFSFAHMAMQQGEARDIPIYQANYLCGMRFVESDEGDRRFKLWKPELMTGLDHFSEMGLLLNGYEPVPLRTGRPMITDVKSGRNIWNFEHLSVRGTAVEVEEATSFFTWEERSYVERYLSNDLPTEAVPAHGTVA